MLNLLKMFRAGLNCQNCELLFNVMTLYRRRMVNTVLRKAQIPFRKAINAIGILDEAGVLKEGEVYAKYTHPRMGLPVPVLGPVVVGRTPCLHPGDIQKARAVSYPELEHLQDVIVFSRFGSRPLPNKLSGGDLDGDIYVVIWDKEITDAVQDASPMDYTPERKEKLDRPVEIKDVKSFMVTYMQRDNLGKIANSHLVHADREPEGIYSIKAQHLAQLHSTAVDFAKTGKPANIPRHLILRNKPGSFPDYMGRPKRVSYESKNALGLMYRHCVGGKSYRRPAPFSVSGNTYSIDRIFRTYANRDPSLFDEALVLCSEYNEYLRRLIGVLAVDSEAEVVSGLVSRFKIENIEPRGRSKGAMHRENLQVLNRHMRNITNSLRERFYGSSGVDCEQVETSSIGEAEIRKVSAWYMASKVRAEEDKRLKKTPILSFPFVAADALLETIRRNASSTLRQSRFGPSS